MSLVFFQRTFSTKAREKRKTSFMKKERENGRGVLGKQLAYVYSILAKEEKRDKGFFAYVQEQETFLRPQKYTWGEMQVD